MSGGQSYVIRLLRRLESSLSEKHRRVESSKVEKIIQKLGQADDIREALDELSRVGGMNQFALRLMWLLDEGERGRIAAEDGVLQYHTALLEDLLTNIAPSDQGGQGARDFVASDEIDRLYESLHSFGRAINGLKQHSMDRGGFKGIEENDLYNLLQLLALFGDRALSTGKKDLAEFANACSGFIHHVLDNSLLHDIRVVNILDNANLTLQTVFDVAGAEDNDSLQSLMELLRQPRELLD